MKIESIQNGIVLDHISAGKALLVYHDLGLDQLDCSIGILQNVRSNKMGKKDILKIHQEYDINLDVLGYIDPDITVSIIKDGPSERRRFIDMELCQLDSFYLYNLNHYNKIVNQRNQLLKDLYFRPDLRETLNIWDSQLVSFGSKIIERRKIFVEQLNEIIRDIHLNLSGGKEEIRIVYEPNVDLEEYESKMLGSQERDIKAKMTTVGPHRDDFCFVVGDIDIRKFGSQGQQRTAALSLKLSEIELVKRITKDTPILLLDDVLSELDSNRQNYLLNSIGDIQTIITCTGLEEFVSNRFEIDKVFKVSEGEVSILEEAIERNS